LDFQFGALRALEIHAIHRRANKVACLTGVVTRFHVVTRGTDICGPVYQPVLGAQIMIGARPFAAIPCGPHQFLFEPRLSIQY
jgi:hypothetical protein